MLSLRRSGGCRSDPGGWPGRSASWTLVVAALLVGVNRVRSLPSSLSPFSITPSIPRRGNGAAVSSAQRHRGTRILGVAYGPACLCPPSHNRLLCSAVVTAAVGHGAGGGGWCRTGGAAPLHQQVHDDRKRFDPVRLRVRAGHV